MKKTTLHVFIANTVMYFIRTWYTPTQSYIVYVLYFCRHSLSSPTGTPSCVCVVRLYSPLKSPPGTEFISGVRKINNVRRTWKQYLIATFLLFDLEVTRFPQIANLSPCVSLLFPQTQTQHHLRCFSLSQTSSTAHQSGVCSTRLSVAVPGEPLGYPLFHSVEKGAARFALKAKASTKASSRRCRGCPGFNKAAASGRQGLRCAVTSGKQEGHFALRRPTHHLVGGVGSANKPRSVSRGGGKVGIKWKRKQAWFEVGY